MILLTPDLRYALRANAICAHAADSKGERFDPAPILKFFNPLGAGTWLATELYADDDTLFGLADLGFGCPELGTFSLAEIASVRLPFGMGIERDIVFSSPHPLSLWADTARRAGSVLWAEQLLRRAAPGTRPDLPNDPDCGIEG